MNLVLWYYTGSFITPKLLFIIREYTEAMEYTWKFMQEQESTIFDRMNLKRKDESID